jgi:hypothetical protein
VEQRPFPSQKTGSTAITEWLFDNGLCHLQAFAGEYEHYKKDFKLFDQKQHYGQGLEFYSKCYQQQ